MYDRCGKSEVSVRVLTGLGWRRGEGAESGDGSALWIFTLFG